MRPATSINRSVIPPMRSWRATIPASTSAMGGSTWWVTMPWTSWRTASLVSAATSTDARDTRSTGAVAPLAAGDPSVTGVSAGARSTHDTRRWR